MWTCVSSRRRSVGVRRRRSGTTGPARSRELALTAALSFATSSSALAAQPAAYAQTVSGSGQTAHAWVSTGSVHYLTDFPQPLDVQIVGSMKADDGKRRVRYRCVTPGCVLAPADGVAERIDPSAYDVDIGKDGHAKVVVSIEALRPDGVYRISAQPLAGGGQHLAPVTFVLTSR